MSPNQFNRGAALLIDRDEKRQVATLDLRAGRKGQGVGGLCFCARVFFGRHGAVGRNVLGQPV